MAALKGTTAVGLPDLPSASQPLWLPLQGYLQYIRSLPLNDSPELFGLHENANITFAQKETFALLGAIMQLQPKMLTLGGRSREEVGAPFPSVHAGTPALHRSNASTMLPPS